MFTKESRWDGIRVLKTRKRLLFNLLGVLPLMAISACSDSEEVTPAKGLEEEQSYYLSLNVEVPTTAQTRDGNTIEGTTIETDIQSADIFLCDDNNYNIKMKFTGSYDKEGKKIISKFDESKMTELLALKNLTLKILVLANNTASNLNFDHSGLTSLEDAYVTFSSRGAGVAPLGTFNYSSEGNGNIMPLVNENDDITVRIPETEEKILAQFTNSGNGPATWHLNSANSPVTLERVVARLEYRDVPRSDEQESDLTDNAHVFQVTNATGLYLKLYSLFPFNVNNSSYLFRHTTGNNNNNNNEANNTSILFGNNNPAEWVRTPDWENNEGWDKNTTYFYNKLTVNRHDYSFSGKGGEVLIESLFSNQPADGDYYPFCYVSENTLPSTELMNEDNLALNATGVAFTFQVLDKEGNPLTSSTVNEKFPDCITKSNKDGQDNWITISDNEFNYIDIEPVKDTDENVSYYYLTYIYCLPHNQSSNGTLNPMHYGVVRNHSYRIQIGGIAHLPLPQLMPIYLKVNCKVLAWEIMQYTEIW